MSIKMRQNSQEYELVVMQIVSYLLSNYSEKTLLG